MTRSMMLLGMALLAAAPAAAQEVNDAAGMMRKLGSGGLEGKKLKKAIEKAEANPLGSRDNPVRADLPEGQRAYLRRLRCADGAAPRFERSGSAGIGPYGYMLDGYAVTCPGAAAVEIYMDLYHRHDERRPVPGFTVVSD